MISIWLLIKGGTDVSTTILGPLPRGDITVHLLSLPRSCREYSLTCWHPEDTDKIESNHVDISNWLDLITDCDFVAAIGRCWLLEFMYGHFHTSRYYPSDVHMRPYFCLARDILHQMSYDLFFNEFVSLPPNQVYLTKSPVEPLNRLWRKRWLIHLVRRGDDNGIVC